MVAYVWNPVLSPLFAVLELALSWMPRIFEAWGHMLEIGIPALHILVLAWLAAIPVLVISAGLQGLSMGMGSMLLAMARRAVLPLVFAGIFSRLGNLNLLWIDSISAELLGLPAAMWFWRKGCRRMEGEKFQ